MGKWHSTQTDADAGESVAFEFTADGSLTIAGQSETATIKATTSGGIITLKLTTGGQTIDGGSIKYVVSGTELTLSDPSNPGPTDNICTIPLLTQAVPCIRAVTTLRTMVGKSKRRGVKRQI